MMVMIMFKELIESLMYFFVSVLCVRVVNEETSIRQKIAYQSDIL